MKGAHHPVYKPQRGFKTWKEKKEIRITIKLL